MWYNYRYDYVELSRDVVNGLDHDVEQGATAARASSVSDKELKEPETSH
jgi:hypothetical protein